MAIVPGWRTIVEKVPELATARGFLRALVTALGVGALALILLLWLEGRWPFLALVLQLVIYAVLRWLMVAFFRGRQDRVPYADALYNRFMPTIGLNGASVLYVLFTAGALMLPADQAPRLVPVVVGVLAAVYLLASALLLLWRALQSAGLDTILGLYVYYPDEGRQVEEPPYTVVRHPVYAAIDRMTLAFGLWNGTAYALLLAMLFTALWHPVWYGIEERELVERFGESYSTYAKTTPAVIPQGLAGEQALWRTLFRRPA
jgi:protein-S-isoprenylcysteine O-methyltransferase Ste14